MRTALLALVYYLVVTPVGLVCRIVHDPLRRRLDPAASTYMIYLGGTERAARRPSPRSERAGRFRGAPR